MKNLSFLWQEKGANAIDMGRKNLAPTLNQLLTATLGQAGG